MNVWEKEIIRAIESKLRNMFDIATEDSNLKADIFKREDGVIVVNLSGNVKIHTKELGDLE